MIVAQINCDPGNQRDPEKQVYVRPKNERIHAVHKMDEMMMVDPVNRDNDEAKNIREENRPHSRQGSRCWIMRRLQLQHHNRDENGDDTIAECFNPIRLHSVATLRNEPVTSDDMPQVVSRQLS